MTLRRKKSRKAQAADALGTYLKIKAAGKAAKGAKKAAKGAGAYQVAKRTPVVKRVPLILAGTAAAASAAFVVFKVRGAAATSSPPPLRTPRPAGDEAEDGALRIAHAGVAAVRRVDRLADQLAAELACAIEARCRRRRT